MFQRCSGILMHISSLPGPWGIGDLGSCAREFANACHAAGQSWWQVLPLNPTTPQCGNSPYFSSSAFAGNPLLISLDQLVQQGLLTQLEIGVPDDPDPTRVDFETVAAYKLPLLEKARQRFFAGDDHEPYHRFCQEQNSWLDDYALFMALGEHTGSSNWKTWPQPLRDRREQALANARAELANSITFHQFLQFLFFEQWHALRRYCNELGLKIVGDIPIYVSYESADVWVHRNYFKLDGNAEPTGVSGVPPDYFSETGQLWNNPVYNWQQLKADGFAWWVKRMKATFERFDVVRIDHIRGLVQFWEVPAGETTAINGSWQEVPCYDFFDTMLREIPGFPVIAEDLGCITDDVREMMNRYGFPGMKVLLFAFGADDPAHPYLPHNFERNCIVYTGTHDNNTFKGWLEDEATPQEIKRVATYLGHTLSPDHTVREMVRLALSSIASVCVLAVQDLLALDSTARMNQPATPSGNWHWRLSPEQFEALPLTWLKCATYSYGRIPAHAGTVPSGQ